MRILIEGRSYRNYLAKCHEAFRTGLRGTFDARCFGKGYRGYWPFVKTYGQIARRVFPDSPPDIVIGDFEYPVVPAGFNYRGFAQVDCLRAMLLSDYWGIAEEHNDGFVQLVEDNKIDVILSYFRQPLDIWQKSRIGKRFIYSPPSFDPQIFNDWQVEKSYDVGFLAAGTLQLTPFYPERHAIHQKLLRNSRIKYLWAPHPGWKEFRAEHPLVGKGFSRAINSCRIFITTGGILHTAHAKYVEILASKSLLMADEPIGAERLGLKDGYNYVKISADDVMDKIDYYLGRPDEAQAIAERGYFTALQRHSCYVRAVEFYEAIRNHLGTQGRIR